MGECRRFGSQGWAALVFVALMLSGLGTPQAQTSRPAIGVQGGYNMVFETAFVGVHGKVSLARLSNVSEALLYPKFEILPFDDDILIYSVGIDIIVPVTIVPAITPYAGVGVRVTHEDTDPGSVTAGDLNLVAGLGVETQTAFRPFFELDVTLFGTDTIWAGLGLSFTIPEPEEENPLPEWY